MTDGHENPGTGETRRDFIKKTATAAAVLSGAGLLPSAVYGQGRGAKVALVSDEADSLLKQPPVRWALDQLQDRLKSRNVLTEVHSSLDKVSPDAVVVLVAGHTSKLARPLLEGSGVSIPNVPEAVGLIRGQAADRSVLLASGSDVRGVVYAVLELADRVEHAPNPIAELERPDRIVEQPANRVRSIARLFTSEVEDKAWYYDKSFWEQYL